MTDWQLLRKFADENSQAAFAELWLRYTSLVYRVCQRELGDLSLAEDAAQAVFLLLAKKAPSLKPSRADATLSSWLFQAALLTAKNARRQEQQRQAHELEAAQMQTQHSAGSLEWTEVEPLLNAALQALSSGQRTIILERFFQDRPLAEVGIGLGISEDAARMRVNRALDRLRRWFAARNIALSAAALASLLPEAVRPAPAHAAEAISRLALPTSGGSTAAQTLAQGVFHAMNLHRLKLQLGAVALVAVFVLGTAGAVRVTTQMKARRIAAEQQENQAQALAIMNRMYATYAAMKSFSCHDSIRQERIGATSSADYEIERPGKVRFHRVSTFTPGPLIQPYSVNFSGQSLTVCDGSNIYQSSTESHGLANRYVKMPFSRSFGLQHFSLGLQYFGNWGGLPANDCEVFAGMPSVAVGSRIRPFVNLNTPEYSIGQPTKVDISGSGHPILLDVVIAHMSHHVGTPGADFPGAEWTVTHFIGQQDHLLYQVVVTEPVTPTSFNTMTETISNMEISEKIDPADFVFTPPPGSHEVQMAYELFPKGSGG